MLLIFVLYALGTLPLSKVLLSYSSPFFLVGIRMTSAGIILFLYHLLRQKLKLQMKHFFLYAQIILFAIFFPYVLRYVGLKYCSTSTGYILLNTGPLITYLCTHAWGVEKMSVIKTGTLIMGFVGSLLMIPRTLPIAIASQSFSIGWAECALFLSVVLFTFGWIKMRTLMVEQHHSPVSITMIAMLGGGLCALIAAFMLEKQPYIQSELSLFATYLVPIILISNLLCHNLYAFLVKKYSLTFVAFGCFLSPLFAIVYEAVVYNKAIVWQFYPATILIFMGLWIFYREEFKVIENEEIKLYAHNE